MSIDFDLPIESPVKIRKLPDLEIFNKKPVKIPEQILENSSGFHRGPINKRGGYQLIAWSWVAAMIDSLMLVAFSMVFVACFCLATKVSMGVVITSHLFMFIGFMIFALLAVFYMIVLRSFLGFTVGEWACGLRLGSPTERHSKYYSLRVCLRVVIVVLSGFIVLPMLSLLSGKDIPGILSRVRLISPRK